MKEISSLIGIIMIFPLMIAYSCLSWGLVAIKFYGWFILSVFPNLPQFTLLQVIGFLIFSGVFIRSTNIAIKKEYKDEVGWWITYILSPWLTLFCGWLVHLFY